MSIARELAELGGSYGSGGFVGMKNRIINGAMVIDQRNAGASVTSNNSGAYGVDRFFTEAYGGGTLSSQQSSVVPTGFKNSLLITVTGTDTTLGTTDDYEVSQKIEGFNCADLGFGAAGAASITLSFWVRSSVTGTYSVGFQNSDASRSYVGTYTINSANTWEQKSITVSGDTSGTWNTGNSTGLFLRWCLATGTNRVAAAANTWESANRIAVSATANPIMGTNGATFYITGVQLEKGSTATSFDYRPYGTELQLCQRYCEVLSFNYDQYTGAAGFATTSAVAYFAQPWTQVKRAIPSITFIGYNYQGQGLSDTSSPTALSAVRIALTAANLNLAATYSGTNGQAVCMRSLDNNQKMIISAEL